MDANYVQCSCGQVLAVPPNATRVRCPTCGAALRLGTSRGPRRGPERGMAARSGPTDPTNEQDDGGEYQITPQAPSNSGAPGEASAGTWVSHVPASGSSAGASGPPTRRAVMSADHSDDQGADWSVELPGPFFSAGALVYPLVHPNWIRWLGLSFVTALATLMVAGSLFVISIIVRFGAFLSFFFVGSMATGCLAFVAYVAACFVAVIEGTANGEDRIDRLPGLSWWDTLPPFLRAAGAAAVSIGLAVGIAYPLRRWLMWPDAWIAAIEGIVVFQVFPVFLITNLADQSVLPLNSLLTTLSRLASRAGYFAVFQILAAAVTAATAAVLMCLAAAGRVALLAGCGPLIAAWLMFYGHWLGRLVRQLAIDE